ncbi:MAG: exonuclease SbcCD subunit D C-terminal domain-containing protein [Proteobacteria bacterium]|nr:exonuclease SbcCD subunit D C-terminal domain-containing protein [Pseudomonadota bacterium]
MRVLHTSDWHLGHALKDVTREYEHARFLAWLLEICDREAVDAVVITGDVFDSSTPPASAERMWFDWVAAARRARPAMDIVAIAGNHDSPARLGAASAVLHELGVHVIGGFDRARFLIPIAGGRGLVAAVPFLRPIDLPVGVEITALYAEVMELARARRQPGQALIVTGHLYLAGADPTWTSERRISIGGQESASARMFPADISYVALGHMHRAQRVMRDTMRYAGAPIPLSLDEARNRHSVVLVDLVDGQPVVPRLVPIPRTIEIVRLGPAPLVEILAEIATLPDRVEPGPSSDASDAVDRTRPYLEVIVELARPEPRLRQTIETALDRKRARLVRLGVEHTGTGATLGDHAIAQRLAELDPRDVFRRCWAKVHEEAPSAEVIGAFERLLADVELAS